MLSKTFITSPSVASKTYKFLVKELDPPKSVSHFPKNGLFAQFPAMTFTVKALDKTDNPSAVTVSLYLHDTNNQTLTELFARTTKKINGMSKKEVDTLDPFV